MRSENKEMVDIFRQ